MVAVGNEGAEREKLWDAHRCFGLRVESIA